MQAAGHEYKGMFSARLLIQVAGSLAQKKAKAGAQVQGVLVQQGGKHTVVAAQDLSIDKTLLQESLEG